MSKMYQRFLSISLLIVWMLIMVSSYHLCLANEEQLESNEPIFQKIVCDFSNQASGFTLNNYWVLQESELQFNSDQKSRNRFYMIHYSQFFPTNYTIATNVRWIDGHDYGFYGLYFKQSIYNYYTFMTNLSGNVALFKKEDNKWKTVKKIKHNTRSKTQYDCLKVICDGSTIKCFINDKKVFDIKDHTEPDNVGVGICTDGNVQCGYKDFTIEEIAGKE